MLDQNTLELEIALERLEEKLGDSSFSYHSRKVESLFQQIQSNASQPLKDKFDTLSEQHREKMSVESAKIKAEIDALIEAVEVPEMNESNLREVQSRVDSSKHQLEKVQDELKTRQVGLTRKDQDATWQYLKEKRQSLRDVRKAMGTLVRDRAEALFVEAQTSVNEEVMLKVARQTFIDLQKEVNTLPLRRQDRQVYHEKFDTLWQTLQTRYKQHREEKKERQRQWKERQADGLQRLEAALERVEQLIEKAKADIARNEGEVEESHWMDQDRIQGYLERDKSALKDAERRQQELLEKIADAKRRLAE